MTVMLKFTAIESFSGAGGMALGLGRAGFDVKLSFDLNEPAIKTHLKNIGRKAIVADASVVTGRQLRSKANLGRRRLDLFSGGPPCQGFSKQKRGAHNGDVRNDLILQFVRLVDELQPKFFLLENVAIFGQIRGHNYREALRDKLDAYSFFPSFHNSADFGLAQTRKRFILVGKHKSVRAPFSHPSPTCKKWSTVKDVIGDLPEPPLDYSVHDKFPNHQNARVTPINVKRFAFVPQGGGWKNIPYRFRLPSHQRVNVSQGGWPDVYGRLKWGGQCPTITAGFDSFTRGRYGHPKSNRPLTPREAARLQGFPDWFEFLGNRGDVRSQIGNAVPPPLAEAIGKSILKCLQNDAKGVSASSTRNGREHPAAHQLSLVMGR